MTKQQLDTLKQTVLDEAGRILFLTEEIRTHHALLDGDLKRLFEADGLKDPRVEVPALIHRPLHMRGWEAFGVDGESPEIRKLGMWTGPKLNKWEPGTEAWAAGETRNGVGSIEIHTYAGGEGAYIYVCGTTEKGVRDAWERAHEAFNTTRHLLWNRPVPKEGSDEQATT